MATAIPEAFTFALQSRLPANSFVVTWKEFRPDTMPRGNTVNTNLYTLQLQGQSEGSGENVRIYFRGAPNEFLLNTNSYLVGTSFAQARQTPTVDDSGRLFTGSARRAIIQNNPSISLGNPTDYFSGSRESFNSGSLPYYDNQDRTRSHIINRLRSLLAKRNYMDGSCSEKQDLIGTTGDRDSLAASINLYMETSSSIQRSAGKTIFNLLTSDAQRVWSATTSGSNKDFQIPLGYFSNLINTHSVIPIGLMSAYSCNGWGIDLNTVSENENGWSGNFNPGPFTFGAGSFTQGGSAADISFDQYRHYMSNLKVYAPVIQILDPSVMDSILSLYEKREMVNLGGVQFPLSLRMNSLAYRFSSFPIRSGQQDYHFRVAGTDRSVRGIAFIVSSAANIQRKLVLTDDLGIPPGLNTLNLRSNLKLTRLDTKIGNEHIHEVIEDQTSLSSNINNFLNINIRKSGSLWSPLPQYMENKRFEGQSEDLLSFYNNSNGGYICNGSLDSNDGYSGSGKNCILYGVVSFENLDRREGDHQGSYQASGKDLTNVGGIEISMRFHKTYQYILPTGNVQEFNPEVWGFEAPNQDYEINFAYVYDSVMEISPSGVMDITNAVL